MQHIVYIRLVYFHARETIWYFFCLSSKEAVISRHWERVKTKWPQHTSNEEWTCQGACWFVHESCTRSSSSFPNHLIMTIAIIVAKILRCSNCSRAMASLQPWPLRGLQAEGGGHLPANLQRGCWRCAPEGDQRWWGDRVIKGAGWRKGCFGEAVYDYDEDE